MNKNEYSALVDKLAEEIIEGVMEKEAGVGDKLFDKAVMANNAAKAAKGNPSKFKGAVNKVIDGINKKRSSAMDKLTDAARRAKDTKAYGVGKGMLGSSKRQSIAAASAGFGVGAAAGGMRMKHKTSEGSKAAAEINEFIEKVAEHNNMDVNETADILERVASAYQEAISKYEDSQLRKEAAGEVFNEADEDETEAAAQLEAAVQVMEELGIPVDELLGEEDEDEEYEEDGEDEE